MGALRDNIEAHVAPVLETLGFTAGPWTWRRLRNDGVDLVGFERTRSGDRYRVWLGRHHSTDTAPGGVPVRDLNQIVRRECARQWVLPRPMPEGWSHPPSPTRMLGDSPQEASERMQDLARTLQQSMDWFDSET